MHNFTKVEIKNYVIHTFLCPLYLFTRDTEVIKNSYISPRVCFLRLPVIESSNVA